MALGRDRRSRQAASTAEGACALRAAGAAEPDQQLRCPDHMAAGFITWGLKMSALSKVPGLRRLTPRLVERIIPGGYLYEIGRTKHMDAVLLEEVEGGVRQAVILGAGFDTRPYRLAELLEGVAMFEVDHPLTAAVKRQRVERVLGWLPDHVTYVEVDFTRDDLAERLEAGGYDASVPATFVWSGVCMYVPEEGVRAVLSFVGSQAPGSSIVFDYCWREMIEGDDSFYGARELRALTERMDEPLVFGILRDGVEEFLREHSLELEQDIDPDEFKRRYLTLSDGSLAGEPYGFGSIARARVPGRR
jgi:methyltransferase (TIGR00027 family)